jgi:hypothetical protein
MPAETIQRHSAFIDQLKLAGWIVLFAVGTSWIVGVSWQVIDNYRSIGEVESREDAHYEHLHSDIEEVKGDVKELLQRSRSLVAGGRDEHR